MKAVAEAEVVQSSEPTVAELKADLRERGLRVTGNKVRLAEVTQAGRLSLGCHFIMAILVGHSMGSLDDSAPLTPPFSLLPKAQLKERLSRADDSPSK